MIEQKFEKLKSILKDLEGVAIGFSGGVDSTFLVKVAYDVLGSRAIAVTSTIASFPKRELDEACAFARELGIEHIIIKSDEFKIQGFAENSKDRCYYCKKAVFTKIIDLAKQRGISYVLDGSNLDDTGDYRPGAKAAEELKIISPLKIAGMTKNDIRLLSKELGLPTWDKPAYACLATRVPYGQTITYEMLKMIEEAEDFLIDKGFKQVRVRHHGETARIEVSPEERHKFFNEEFMDEVSNKLKEIGFVYASLELSGYRTGSLNEVLKKKGEI